MEPIRPHNGYTLIELLVVLAIITIVTAVVLTSQSAFNKTLVLANTAYDVALTLRYTETYGVGSRTVGQTTNPGYGLHFSSGSPTSFTLFVDTSPPVTGNGTDCHPAPGGPQSALSSGPSALPGDCVYNGSTEKVQDYALGNGITIKDFCAQQQDLSWSCEKANGLQLLDIVFSRPNPTPFMSEGGAYNAPNPVTFACIVLTSSQGGSKVVSIGAAGQIRANDTTCGP